MKILVIIVICILGGIACNSVSQQYQYAFGFLIATVINLITNLIDINKDK